MDSLNVFEQELAPAIVNDTEAIVPKTHSSPKTVRDERFRFLDRQIASGALRALRHSLCHEISFQILRNSPSFAGALRDGMGSSSLKAEVKVLLKLISCAGRNPGIQFRNSAGGLPSRGAWELPVFLRRRLRRLKASRRFRDMGLTPLSSLAGHRFEVVVASGPRLPPPVRCRMSNPQFCTKYPVSIGTVATVVDFAMIACKATTAA